MAQETMKDSQLRMVYDQGLDLEGNPIMATKNYNNIKTTATATGLYTVAQAIQGLQQHTLVEVERNSSYFITA